MAAPAPLPLLPRLLLIAPDLRGYDDTDVPPLATSYTMFHIVGDLVGLVDKLGIEQVFLVGYDWGAVVTWYFCMLRPDRIKALVNSSMAFLPRNPARKPGDGFRALFASEPFRNLERLKKSLLKLILPD